MAEWNPEKDLLAMVTEDSKILLHRFNWQRLWNISPGELLVLLLLFFHVRIAYFIFVFIKCNYLNFRKLTSVFLILGKSITSLCWRPDGKAIAVGLEDGTVSLHDVEVSTKCSS